MINSTVMSRYQFLFMGLTEVSEKEALVAELNHFKAGPSAGQVGNDSTLLDAYLHSVNCLEYEDSLYRKVHKELIHAFSWHLSAAGEAYWHGIYTKYLYLDRQAKQERIAAQLVEMADSEAVIEEAKSVISQINEITALTLEKYESDRAALIESVEAERKKHEEQIALDEAEDKLNREAAAYVPPLAEDAPDEQ